ncbi:MAG: isochorismatase family protein [Pseudomonadota bacterium]
MREPLQDRAVPEGAKPAESSPPDWLADRAVLVIDVQPSFNPPDWLVDRCRAMAGRWPSIATVFHHDESQVPYSRQIGWQLPSRDDSLVRADHVVIKHGYGPSQAVLDRLADWRPGRVLVCGIEADACVLAAGFALFDAGLRPTLVGDAVAGSSRDPDARETLGLWQHHIGPVTALDRELDR